MLALPVIAGAASGILRVVMIQPQSTSINTTSATIAAHLDLMNASLAHAAGDGADIVIFPEGYLQGYSPMAMPFAEPANGPSAKVVASLAQSYGVAVTYNYFELGADGKVYDTIDVYDMTGTMILHYRKVNLAAGENQFLTAGDTIGPVVQLTTNNGTYQIGALICFDVFFPETSRLLALQGAQFIIIPTANGYPANYNPIANVLVPARGLENGVAVAYVNWVQIGPSVPPLFQMHGNSILVNNDVAIARGASGSQQYVLGEVNMKGWTPSTVVTTRAAADLDGLCTN